MRPLLALLLLSSMAEARVLNFKEATTAAYVRGTAGFSQLAQDTFANEAGGGALEQSTKYNYGAEFGFAFGLGALTRIRLGAEIIQQNAVSGAGVDSDSVTRYNLNSSVFVFNPNIALEHVWSADGALRYYWALGGGYANVTASNDYKMTPAGTAILGVQDFKESMAGTGLSAAASMGLETMFADNATLMIDAGYRYMPIRTLKYTSDVTNFMGAQKKGDTVLNSDGSKRTMNLGGIFMGLMFRFYFM